MRIKWTPNSELEEWEKKGEQGLRKQGLRVRSIPCLIRLVKNFQTKTQLPMYYKHVTKLYEKP